jgi:glycosyltransferase involved in cell wall biosynthesis
MNILMLLMTEFKHDARVTKEARSLVNAGHRVVVAGIKDIETDDIERRENFVIQRMSLFTRYRLPKGNVFFFLKYIEYVFRTVLEYKNKKFDAYHAHDLETVLPAYLLATLNQKPVVYDSHELYVEQDRHSNLRKFVWRTLEKFLASRVTVTFMETESRANIYAQRYNVEQPQILMNCQYLNIADKSDKFREMLPIRNNERIILYQGGIEKNRGCDQLLDAMSHLEDVALVFLGNGGYKQTLREKAINHPKSENIFVLDAVPWEQLAAYTASADLGVFPLQNVSLQYYYALSNKLFEFLSAGLPVVISDFPEMRKVVVDNNVGIAVDETNPKEISDAIGTILADPDLYTIMSENAVKIVREKYNWDIEVKKLLDVYKACEETVN